MLFLIVLATGLLTVRVAGGRLTALAELQLRGRSQLVIALFLQILTISVLRDPPHKLAAGLHLTSYGFAGAFLWANRRLPGLHLTAAGGAVNLLAITANSGIMPATASALRTAGISRNADHFANSTTVAHPRLAFLGDVFAVPQAFAPIANVFSIGDVTLALGAIWLLHAAAGCRWPHAARHLTQRVLARSVPVRRAPAARTERRRSRGQPVLDRFESLTEGVSASADD